MSLLTCAQIDGSYCSYSAFGETGNSPLDPPYPDPSNDPRSYKGHLQCGVYKPTNVISISYGGQEADLPVSYQRRQCNEFLKLGMQGVSVVVASGDSGVAGPKGDDSANGCLGGGTIFSPVSNIEEVQMCSANYGSRTSRQTALTSRLLVRRSSRLGL